jgi:hypothetical protein
MDAISDFAVGGVDALNLDSAGTIAADATVDGANSTAVLTTDGTDVIKSHKIVSGIITFDDVDTFAEAVTLSDTGDVATAIQYLAAQDLGAASTTVAFVAAGNTYVYQQNTADAGTTGGYALVQLTSVNATSLMLTGTAAGGVLIA